jgi:hypothetical protein
MRRSGEPEPDSPGGHAAERLREFLAQRFGRRVKTLPGEDEEPTLEVEEAPVEDDERPRDRHDMEA